MNPHPVDTETAEPDGRATLSPRRAEATSRRGRGLHGQLVESLGQMIVSGDIDSDRPLVPGAVCRRFDVSRTVVRETIRVLQDKGLVSSRPNIGTWTLPVSAWNLLDRDIIRWRSGGPDHDAQNRELTELRGAIEPLAARLAVEHGPTATQERLTNLVAAMGRALERTDIRAYARADVEFHGVLVAAAKNHLLSHLAKAVTGALESAGDLALCCDIHPHALSHHRLFVSCLTLGDSHGAEAAIRRLFSTSPAAVPAARSSLDHTATATASPAR